MTELLARIRYEPEIFENVDDLFVKCNGEIVLVRCRGGFRWSIVVKSGQFKCGGDTVGYNRLSFLENLALRKSLARVPKRKKPAPQLRSAG